MRSSIFAAAAVGFLVLVCPVSSQAQTADEIIAKNLQAKGGAEKWRAISSVKMTGKLSSQGRDVAMTVYTKRPNLMRQDVTTPVGTAVQAFDGVTPWMIPPGADAAREVTGPQAEAARSGADFDGPLLDYAIKGHKVELVGKEKVGTAETYHLKLTKKDGNVEHYFMDAESGLEVRRTAETDAGGKKQSLESELSNYKSVDGLMVPHTIKQSVNGAPLMEMTLDKVEFNTPMDNALFRMPKK
jgi:outer membrane lipoprotein-sorting protein